MNVLILNFLIKVAIVQAFNKFVEAVVLELKAPKHVLTFLYSGVMDGGINHYIRYRGIGIKSLVISFFPYTDSN